jgi:hypothetical protein
MRHVGNVEDDQPAVDIAKIGAVRPLGIDIGVVRTEAGIGTLRVALGRRLAVALAGPGQPPAADLDRLGGVFDVDDPVELVITRVARDFDRLADTADGPRKPQTRSPVHRRQTELEARARDPRIRQGGEPVSLAPEWRAVRAAFKRLLAFFRWRPITLVGNNLAMRGRPWPEADFGIGIGGQAFKASGKL